MNDISISEIAAMAGVSKATVSRVINNKPDVGAKTRERILDIMKYTNFHPNARAQSLSQQRSRIIGLVFPYDEVFTFSNPYYSDLLKSILSTIRSAGYRVMLTYIGSDSETAVNQKLVDGLLVLTPGSDRRSELFDLMKLGIPMVSTARVEGLDDLHYVATDEYSASKKITNYLISLGHTCIGFIGGSQSLYSTSRRLKGYTDALTENHIAFDDSLIEYGDSLMESGNRIASGFFKAHPEMSAIFSCSDMMAIGAKHAAETFNLRIPEDVSLVCTDGSTVADYLDAPLTTVRQPTVERGRLAVDHLISLIEGRDPGPSVELPTDIIIRGTTHRKIV